MTNDPIQVVLQADPALPDPFDLAQDEAEGSAQDGPKDRRVDTLRRMLEASEARVRELERRRLAADRARRRKLTLFDGLHLLALLSIAGALFWQAHVRPSAGVTKADLDKVASAVADKGQTQAQAEFFAREVDLMAAHLDKLEQRLDRSKAPTGKAEGRPVVPRGTSVQKRRTAPAHKSMTKGRAKKPAPAAKRPVLYAPKGARALRDMGKAEGAGLPARPIMDYDEAGEKPVVRRAP